LFRAIGYESQVIRAPAAPGQYWVIRLKPTRYHIGEVVVKRFRSYESFLHQVTHFDVPETDTEELKAQLQASSTKAALEADHERRVQQKAESGGFAYITPLGKGINQRKAFAERMNTRKERQAVIDAKFNRKLVADLTNLQGDELSDFMAMCNFSDLFLFETELPTIIDSLYARLDEYHQKKNPSAVAEGP